MLEEDMQCSSQPVLDAGSGDHVENVSEVGGGVERVAVLGEQQMDHLLGQCQVVSTVPHPSDQGQHIFRGT